MANARRDADMRMMAAMQAMPSPREMEERRTAEVAAAQEANQYRQQAEGLLMGVSDPRMAAALDALQQQTAQGPITEDIQSQIASQISDSTAAAANAQRQMAMEQNAAMGGSLRDGSFQALNRGIETDRQLANTGNRRNLAIDVAQQNFGGRQQAAATLGGLRQQPTGQLADYYANAVVESPNNMSQLPSAVPGGIRQQNRYRSNQSWQ